MSAEYKWSNETDELRSAKIADENSSLDDKIADYEKGQNKQIIQEWCDDQSGNRKLRKTFGIWLLSAFSFQLVFMDSIFFLLGLGRIKLDILVINYWLTALVIEVIGLVLIATRGLYKNTATDFYNLISKLSFTKYKDDDE